MHPALKELLFGFTLEHTDMTGQSPLLRQPREKQSRSGGRPYTRRMIERLTHQWGERAQIPNCLPHRFRHTFATDPLRQGTDIGVIQTYHADLGTTAVYTKVVDAQTGEAVVKAALDAAPGRGIRPDYVPGSVPSLLGRKVGTK